MNNIVLYFILIVVISALVIILIQRGSLHLDEIETGPSWLKVKINFWRMGKTKHNLPQPTYGEFIGREKEVTQIKKILLPYPHSQHSVISIDGIGGVGKSTLALEIAHWYLRNNSKQGAGKRFDAIIWLSAKESLLTADGILPRYKKQSTLTDILQEITYTLSGDINGEVIDDISTMRAKTFSLLSSQRTLLIIDNFESIDDQSVTSFIFDVPAPTKVIVTTRHRIDVSYPVRLSGMEWKDAIQLINQQCESKRILLTEEETSKLYKVTGGIPLAIVWSIALIGYGYEFNSVIRKLSMTTSDIARFCFKQIITEIKDLPAYEVLCALVFLGEANRERLGYIAQLPIRQRDEGIVHLEKLSLINKTQKGDFLVPTLVSEYMLKIMKSSQLRFLEKMVEVVPFVEVAPTDKDLFSRRTTFDVNIPIGKTADGKTFNFVLGSSTEPHALILGATGAGKTELIRTLIMNGLLHYQTGQVEFLVFSPKERVFPPDVLGETELDIQPWMVDSTPYTQSFVDYIQNEFEQRISFMSKYSLLDFSAINESLCETLIPRLVVIIDEISLLLGKFSKFEFTLLNFTRMGRSLGIHFVFLTQTFDPFYKRLNIGARYVLRVNRKEDVQRALGQDFPIPTRHGEALYMGDRGFVKFQVAYLADIKPYLDILKQKPC